MSTLLAPGLVVTGFAVDEWYGLTAEFHWTDAGKARRLQLLEAEGATRGLTGEPWRRAHNALRTLELALRDDVAREILASPETAAYYATPHKVVVEEFGGGRSDGTRTVPRFQPTHFSDWDFWPEGGVLNASTRD